MVAAAPTLFNVSNPSLLHRPDFGLGSDWGQQDGDESGDVSASVAVEESEPETSFSEEEGDASEGGYNFPKPPEEAKVFVGNLDYDVDSQALAMLFEQAGTVEIAEMNMWCFSLTVVPWIIPSLLKTDKPIMASGVTACILTLGLHRLGKTEVPVYDGSWTEWAT
ncbi:unnamed protein product [Brassica napus]|uniref:(rape) hypothetical protein n=1 Tax=Brassica napus TaxID=3708 RepID=A0A816QM09_BRANA|nr:unnamed protein product [Brassica napus]